MQEENSTTLWRITWDLRFLTTVLLKIKIFWDMTPCQLVNSYGNFKGMYHLHLEGQAVLWPLDPEDKGIMIIQHVGNCLSTDMAKCTMNSHVCQRNHKVPGRRNISERHYRPVYIDSICSVSSRIGLSHTGCMGDTMGCHGILPVVKYEPVAHIWGEKHLRNRRHTNPVQTILQRLLDIPLKVHPCWRKALPKRVFHMLMSI